MIFLNGALITSGSKSLDRLSTADGQSPICRSEVWMPSGNSGGQRTKRGLLTPGWRLFLPAGTWHRPRAQSSIMQSWPRKKENRGGIHPSPNKLHSANKPKVSWCCCTLSSVEITIPVVAMNKYQAIKVFHIPIIYSDAFIAEIPVQKHLDLLFSPSRKPSLIKSRGLLLPLTRR